MKRIWILLISFALPTAMLAQDNMIPNGGFENAETKKLKDYGMIDEMAIDWFSATKAPTDLFSKVCKSEKVAIPNNLYGKQDSRSGDNYAGFRAYTKDRKKTRTYLSVKLKDQLEKDAMYCVRMNVSLADLSKYAVNHVGMYFSDRKVIQPNTGSMVLDPQIKKKNNGPVMLMDGWETICGTYIANGQEEYVIIGCFERDEKLDIQKVKKPSGMAGTPIYDAYYFIDDVEVVEVEAKSQCVCSVEDSNEPDLIYSKSVAVDESMTPSEVLKLSTAYYAFLKSDVNPMAKRTLENVITVMTENPSLNIDVVGHCDNDEFKEGNINPRYRDLGMKRAERLVDYLVSKGIDKSRMSVHTKENNSPANTRPTPMSVAQNRRVEFVVR